MPRQQKCPIDGCIFTVVEDVVPVCRRHAIEIWKQVQLTLPPAETAHQHEVRLQADEARRAGVRQEQGWIYFLELDEKIKVGWTSNLEKRLRSYPPHARVVVSYPATRADERDMHRTLRTELVAGREWYGRTPLVLNCMRDAQLAEARRLAAEHERWLAAHPPTPPVIEAPSVRRRKPRPLRGQALVRAILDGEVT
jgi:hypothetical protein